MNSGIVESVSISSRPEVPNSFATAPSKIASKPLPRKTSAPSAVAASMIVYSGAPLMNTRRRVMTRIVVMSVPRSHALGWSLAAPDVVDVDERVQERVQDDQRGPERDRLRDRDRLDELVVGVLPLGRRDLDD